MKVLSVNIGKREKIQWKNKTVETGIYKKPVDTPIFLDTENVVDDHVVDREHHGGKDMAVYAFTKNHYAHFQELYPDLEFYNGIFGENLTVSNLLETEVCIGDVFQIGDAVIQVAQPRFPCFKLGIVFGTQKIVKQYLHTSYCGFYFRVLQKGNVQKGDKIILTKKVKNSMTVADVYSLYSTNRKNKKMINDALALEFLAEKCKANFRRKLL